MGPFTCLPKGQDSLSSLTALRAEIFDPVCMHPVRRLAVVLTIVLHPCEAQCQVFANELEKMGISVLCPPHPHCVIKHFQEVLFPPRGGFLL